MEPATNPGVQNWLAVGLESICSSISTVPDALNSHWHKFTSRYPGLLERCILAIGVAYIGSIGWSLVRIATKVGFTSVRWCIFKISRTLGLALEPIFESSDSGEYVLDKELYGLEHMALNWTWEEGLKTMWMNMGYWKVDTALRHAANCVMWLTTIYRIPTHSLKHRRTFSNTYSRKQISLIHRGRL